MWTCEHCGCQAIAHDLVVCPMCNKPRDTSAVVPTAVEGRASAEESGKPETSSPESGTASPPQASPSASNKVKKEAW
jgi:uncharacterized Zn finger protein (UPF0148 family)